MKAWLVAVTLAGGLASASASQAAPLVAPPAIDPPSPIAAIQFWGGHGDWGHHRHGGYDHGYRRHRHDWGHRDHGWGHHRGWERRHHHHHGHGRYDY